MLSTVMGEALGIELFDKDSFRILSLPAYQRNELLARVGAHGFSDYICVGWLIDLAGTAYQCLLFNRSGLPVLVTLQQLPSVVDQRKKRCRHIRDSLHAGLLSTQSQNHDIKG
jgi:hypothetical protein